MYLWSFFTQDKQKKSLAQNKAKILEMAESKLEILHNLHLYHWPASENIDLGSYWAYGSTNKTSI